MFPQNLEANIYRKRARKNPFFFVKVIFRKDQDHIKTCTKINNFSPKIIKRISPKI